MKDASDLRSKVKQKRRVRRQFDDKRREKSEGSPEKKAYNRRDWKAGKVE